MSFDPKAYLQARLGKNEENRKESFYGKSYTEPTRKAYAFALKQWKSFGEALGSDPKPDLETIQTFLMWYGQTAKGSINDRIAISTFYEMLKNLGTVYKAVYKYKIPRDIIDDIKFYIETDLKDELQLQDKEREKAIADWADIENAVEYLILRDSHEYYNNRYRIQLECIFLLIADAGERIGVIVRSTSYSAKNFGTALLYRDLKLFRLPSTEPDGRPRFKLEITYNNRKGERGNEKQFIEQTYFTRDIPGSCVVCWIMVLLFLDDVFEHCSWPSDLFRNIDTSVEIPITLKRSKLDIPVFRSTERSKDISPTRVVSSDTITADGRRVVAAAGFRQ
ncbi:uncharacterized protein EAF01_004817 [Botrytis porri]|uniref:uncharacterized protein n=1 Tax=Botrytis porri TaxID=87229 RepID=UPI001901C98F|nr:uncharacterized protein EAF01_004817 [Botrytis porri]KAF7907230.1 hypothetical protein EAF01_004817 [Botrytis porri]